MKNTRFVRRLAVAMGLVVSAGVAGGLRGADPQNTAASSVDVQPLASGILLDDFDPAIPPHEDFYLHVNGKWLDRTEIPPDQSNYGIFTVLQENSQKALRELV